MHLQLQETAMLPGVSKSGREVPKAAVNVLGVRCVSSERRRWSVHALYLLIYTTRVSGGLHESLDYPSPPASGKYLRPSLLTRCPFYDSTHEINSFNEHVDGSLACTEAVR